MDVIDNKNFHVQIVQLLRAAKQKVIYTVNKAMVTTYHEIGRMIVEEEQNGNERAEYGKAVLKELSKELTKEFGKGFSVYNLERMRKFYITYSIQKQQDKISATVLPKTKEIKSSTVLRNFELSWSHYLTLMRIENDKERDFYEIEAFKNNWSVRELKRQYESELYTRLALSRDKEKIKELSLKGQVLETPKDVIKDPYILEFIGLPERSEYSESELEQKIIDELESFLLELGTGFSFVSRQKRISFDDKNFYIDLVFYNRILKSFVLIDLKIGELKHQDIGQMQMYVNYYDREIKLEEENKTIGIIICQNKSNSVVEFTLPENNNQIFASKYKTILPSKNELKSLVEDKIKKTELK